MERRWYESSFATTSVHIPSLYFLVIDNAILSSESYQFAFPERLYPVTCMDIFSLPPTLSVQ